MGQVCCILLKVHFVLYNLGFLCGRCGDEEGVTLNLQSCASDCNLGIALFVIWSKLSVGS